MAFKMTGHSLKGFKQRAPKYTMERATDVPTAGGGTSEHTTFIHNKKGTETDYQTHTLPDGSTEVIKRKYNTEAGEDGSRLKSEKVMNPVVADRQQMRKFGKSGFNQKDIDPKIKLANIEENQQTAYNSGDDESAAKLGMEYDKLYAELKANGSLDAQVYGGGYSDDQKQTVSSDSTKTTKPKFGGGYGDDPNVKGGY